ncbi:MAG: hypothetical protein AAB835_00050 [Patescibacteria group bacterium]
MNKTLGVVLVVILVIATAGAYLFPKVQKPLGAMPGPVIQSEFLDVNGVETWYKSSPFNTASTTRCALRAPSHATSTLSSEGVVKAATTTDYTITLAKSATAFATTTLIRELAVTEAGQIALPTASTTVTVLADTNRTFKPGEYLVVSTAGPTATAFDSGYCSAVFSVGR